jgi:hypothetical protein
MLSLPLAARSHFRAIIQATNQQKTQTIASQPSQLILIHPMDYFGCFLCLVLSKSGNFSWELLHALAATFQTSKIQVLGPDPPFWVSEHPTLWHLTLNCVGCVQS